MTAHGHGMTTAELRHYMKLYMRRRRNGSETIRATPHLVDHVDRSKALFDPERDGDVPEHTNLTARTLRDPPPGRSALDQKRMAVATLQPKDGPQ